MGGLGGGFGFFGLGGCWGVGFLGVKFDDPFLKKGLIKPIRFSYNVF